MVTILRIRALHLPIQSAHTQQWTHTHTVNTHPEQWAAIFFMLRRPGSSWGFGALLKGTSVVVLKVERALYIHSPHLQSLPARDSNSQPLDYKSDSLIIRPRLPRREGHFMVLVRDDRWNMIQQLAMLMKLTPLIDRGGSRAFLMGGQCGALPQKRVATGGGGVHNVNNRPILYSMKGSYFGFVSPQQQVDMHAR